jgi:hypothetical protein
MMSDDVKISNGLVFPLVALPAVGYMSTTGEDEREVAQVFFLAASWATKRLVIGDRGLHRGF